MMEIISESMQLYVEKNSSTLHPYLLKVERDTHLNVLHSHMVSGSYQGLLLQFIVKMTKASNILEIGTFTGFATLCMAEALQHNGCIDTIEADAELYEIAKSNIDNSPWKDKITMHCGKALDVMDSILVSKKYDLIFIDADKKSNRQYYDKVMKYVSSGAVILVDNVLWKGKVTEDKMDEMTKSIHLFNEYVANDSNVDKVILPIRDGLTLIRKK
jgi:predicted O-methyltransferase YrrM